MYSQAYFAVVLWVSADVDEAVVPEVLAPAVLEDPRVRGIPHDEDRVVDLGRRTAAEGPSTVAFPARRGDSSGDGTVLQHFDDDRVINLVSRTPAEVGYLHDVLG
jgi:hypothetical protein